VINTDPLAEKVDSIYDIAIKNEIKELNFLWFEKEIKIEKEKEIEITVDV